jgi:hypothetical protein
LEVKEFKRKIQKKNVIILFCICIIILCVIPDTASLFNQKPRIKVAIIRQHWDFLDTSCSSVISTRFHKQCLKSAENKYNVSFRIYEFWDDWNHGDVQKGLLRLKNIDVVIAPGGVGGWYSPLKYRQKIKRFVRSGGGFYGICGDSTFGSLGVENLNKKYHAILCELLGFETLSPMLGLANVYTDASVIKHIIKNPRFFLKLDMIQFLSRLPTSRGVIHIKRSFHPIQDPYQGENIRVMLGNAPLIEGDILRKIIMPPVHTIGVFGKADDPYDRSINHKKAMICTKFGLGRVVLSPIHAELTIGNKKAHDIYVRNVLWLASELE